MTVAMRYAARSDVGLLRDGNEDSLYAGPRLLAVADGMGGHAAGEVASAVAIGTLAGLDEDVPGGDMLDAMRRAVEAANGHLREMVAGDSALAGMGTTVTALLWAGAKVGLAHIGDSRAYLLRDGVLTQMTHDHTLVQALIDDGRITAEEARHHPQRSVMLRALDGRDVDLDLSVRETRVGDRYLLCTDGLSGVLSESTLLEALSLPDRNAAVDRLVELTLRGGGPDNVSCIVADVVDDGAPASEAVLVGGAAAPSEPSSAASGSTAAGRAALVGRRRRAAPEPVRPDALPKRRLTPVLLLVVALLLVVGAGTGLLYARSQYYVGADGDGVAIYRGVGLSVAGVHLSKVQERLGVRIGDLPPYSQRQVRQGIPAESLSAAHRIANRLAGRQPEDCSTTRPSAAASTPPSTAQPNGPTQSAAPAPGPVPSGASAVPAPSPTVGTPACGTGP